MPDRHKRVLFLLFFLSGFCGLLYQVIWMRLAFAAFGIITPVMSVVISVFMLGLFVGSWGAGKVVRALTAATGRSAIVFYALVEVLIGLGAFAVPILFELGSTSLLPAGETDSAGYLLSSALIIATAIFPWCVFMGATYPFMMAFVREQAGSDTASFSFLYLANVFGAMAGTLVTAVVLVELLGFRATLGVAAALNGVVALIALSMSARSGAGGRVEPYPAQSMAPAGSAGRSSSRGTLVLLFVTGFASMAMEVVWARAYMPVLGTEVYSFSTLVFVYLFGTWAGSAQYRRHLARDTVRSTALVLAWLAVAALLPIVLPDIVWRLKVPRVVLGILPLCALLGYLTPKLIDEYSGGSPERAGRSYAINVLGCILGPLVASYVMLPVVGVRVSLLLLAVPFLFLAVGFYRVHTSRGAGGALVKRGLGAATVALLMVAVFVSRSHEERVEDDQQGVVRRDHTATVISGGQGMGKYLLVNGIGITFLTPVTKFMAHLPLALIPETPQSALVICFGMGTTFRSLLSWDLDATAVELVPSVKAAFGYYHADADALLSRPTARIVIDDGRRFLKRTNKTFDVVTLDPPPPIEAAGSSLLYSEEFYELLKSRLSARGILQQWYPGAEDATFRAVLASLKNRFPYVRVYRSIEDWGFHLLASMRPIEVPAVSELVARMPAAARTDLTEWGPLQDASELLSRLTQREVTHVPYDPDVSVRDDRPFNEYYWLRRVFSTGK